MILMLCGRKYSREIVHLNHVYCAEYCKMCVWQESIRTQMITKFNFEENWMHEYSLREFPLFLTFWFNCPSCFEENRFFKVNVLVGLKNQVPSDSGSLSHYQTRRRWLCCCTGPSSSMLWLVCRLRHLAQRSFHAGWLDFQILPEQNDIIKSCIFFLFFPCLKTQNTLLSWRNSQVLVPVSKTAWFSLLLLISFTVHLLHLL